MADFLKIQDKTVTTGGVINVPVDVASGYPECLLTGYRLSGTVTLVSDYELTPSGTATVNQRVIFYNEAAINLDGNNFVIFGETVPTTLPSKFFVAECVYNGSSWKVTIEASLSGTAILPAAVFTDNTIALTKLATATSAYTIVYNAGGVPVAVPITGDIGITNAGVTSIAAGVIVNADINASAAIAFSKLASLTSAYILVGSAGNVPTAVAVTGDVTITNAGVTAIGAAKVTPTMLYGNGAKEAISLAISAESGEQANYAWVAPFAGTIDDIYTYVTKAVAATDDWTITANIGAVAVTDGVVTIAASSTLNTADTATPSANNTFVAGDLITFVSLKTTVGGKCQLTAHVTRT